MQIIRPKAATAWTAAALPLGAAAGLAEKLANGEATVTGDGVVIDGVLAPPLDWLAFVPAVGTTPSTMTVKVVTSTLGTYRGVIVIAAIDSTLDDPVELVYVTGVVGDQFHFAHLPIMSKSRARIGLGRAGGRPCLQCWRRDRPCYPGGWRATSLTLSRSGRILVEPCLRRLIAVSGSGPRVRFVVWRGAQCAGNARQIGAEQNLARW